MTNNNSISQTRGGISFIDMWSIFYLIMVYSFTILLEEANIIVFALYFVCAMPFVEHLDKFICICFALSTMSYYFLGADEGIWSIYTILAVMILLRLTANANMTLSLKSTLYFLWIIVAVILSYSYSEFEYSMGMFAMIYNIAIAVLVATTMRINKDTLVSFLPKITAFQLFAYVGLLLISGHFDGYGFSISERINHNTFGSSVAVLSVIIFVKIVFFKGSSIGYKLSWILSIILIILAGSRNALLAMVLTSILIYVISQIHQGKTVSGGAKFLIVACATLFLGGLLLPEFGIDLSRYNYVELISSGGSNRAIIWETLSPVIWSEHRWFGYGPSHFCSEKMISMHMNLNYKHTHNTIFEAWGELGIFGLVPFLLLLLFAFKRGRTHIKNESGYLMIGFLFVEFLLLGLGESFFANIGLWLVIGLLAGSREIIDDSINTKE